MFLALNYEGSRITATRDEAGFCPGCAEPLAAKMGDIYEWHWSHKPGQRCDYRKSSTFWQYGWMRHYHEMGIGWDMEVELNGFEVDGVNRETGHSLMLVDKFDQVKLQAFIKSSNDAALKPFLIFHPQVFRSFEYKGLRLQHPRRSDNTWVFFFTHAFHGHKRTASCWLDIGPETASRFGLRHGVYNLFYSAAAHGVIQIDSVPRTRRLRSV